jgi:hypothetical protein
MADMTDGQDDELMHLNIADLDVNDLEQRLELASLSGSDCWANACGVNKSA